jgi:hypothetical protein
MAAPKLPMTFIYQSGAARIRTSCRLDRSPVPAIIVAGNRGDADDASTSIGARHHPSDRPERPAQSGHDDGAE